MATKDDFQRAIQSLFDDAISRGENSITVRAGDLHRMIGGYPGPAHSMPAVY
jgi:5-methylcytosine-specific restriction protein A